MSQINVLSLKFSGLFSIEMSWWVGNALHWVREGEDWTKVWELLKGCLLTTVELYWVGCQWEARRILLVLLHHLWRWTMIHSVIVKPVHIRVVEVGLTNLVGGHYLAFLPAWDLGCIIICCSLAACGCRHHVDIFGLILDEYGLRALQGEFGGSIQNGVGPLLRTLLLHHCWDSLSMYVLCIICTHFIFFFTNNLTLITVLFRVVVSILIVLLRSWLT